MISLEIFQKRLAEFIALNLLQQMLHESKLGFSVNYENNNSSEV
jgi:hypothetical protein